VYKFESPVCLGSIAVTSSDFTLFYGLFNIMTRLRFGRSGVPFSVEERIFSLSETSIPYLGPTQLTGRKFSHSPAICRETFTVYHIQTCTEIHQALYKLDHQGNCEATSAGCSCLVASNIEVKNARSLDYHHPYLRCQRRWCQPLEAFTA
jgi:hypothetical protein